MGQDLKVSQMISDPSLDGGDFWYVVHFDGTQYLSRKALVSQMTGALTSIRVATNYTTNGERYVIVTDVTTSPTPRSITLSTEDFIAKKVVQIKDGTNTASLNNIITVAQGGQTLNHGSAPKDVVTDGGTVLWVSDGTAWELMLENVFAPTGPIVTLFIDTSSAPQSYMLPTPALNLVGKLYLVKDATHNAATNVITVTVTGGANIDNGSTSVINANSGVGKYFTNGTKWFTA